ncbi:hypothetical protein Hdeb2414_s0006g00198841 [Helianthus debilis subsp. tardiflorus]
MQKLFSVFQNEVPRTITLTDRLNLSSLPSRSRKRSGSARVTEPRALTGSISLSLNIFGLFIFCCSYTQGLGSDFPKRVLSN